MKIRYVITQMFTQLYGLEVFLHETMVPLGWKYEYDESMALSHARIGVDRPYAYDAFIDRSNTTDTFGFDREDFVRDITEMCNMSSRVCTELRSIQELHVELLLILGCQWMKDDLHWPDEPGEDTMNELLGKRTPSILSQVDKETADNMPLHNKLTAVADSLTDLLHEIRNKSFYISDDDSLEKNDGANLMQVLQNNRVSKVVEKYIRDRPYY